MRLVFIFLILFSVSCPAMAAITHRDMKINGIDRVFTVKIHERLQPFLEDLRSRSKGTFEFKKIWVPCRENGLNFDLVRILTRTGRCRFDHSDLVAVRQTQGLCQTVYDPISMMASIPLKKRYEYNTSSIEELVNMVGSAMARTGVLPAFRKQWIKDKSETIIAKIRHKTYSKQYGRRRQALVNLRRRALRCSARSAGVLHSTISELQSSVGARLRSLSRAAPRNQRHLPYPLLTADERKWISMVLGALAWRMRGGGIFIQDNPTFMLPQWERRHFIKEPFAAIARLNAGFSVNSVGYLLWYPLMFKGYGQYFDMGHLPNWRGRNDCGTQAQDYFNMSRRGQYFIRYAAEYLNRKGYDVRPLVFAGNQIGACYLLSWQNFGYHQRIRWTNRNWTAKRHHPPIHWEGIAHEALTWGEICYGAGLGLALSETLQSSRRPGRPMPRITDRTVARPCR